MFSPTEEKIIKILGRKKQTITELTTMYYRGKKKPVNANSLVSGAIIHINKKCKYHKLAWFVNGYGLGRGGKTVWKDKLIRSNN